MARPSRFSPEVRERAVRMVFEHAQDHASQWATITSIAEKIGCAAETLRSWVRQAEREPTMTREHVQAVMVFTDGMLFNQRARLAEPSASRSRRRCCCGRIR